MNHGWQAIRYPLAGALSFAIMTLFVKSLDAKIPVMEVILARATVSLVASYWGIRRINISPWGNSKRLLLLRGITGFAALSLIFYAIPRMSLAEWTLIQYAYPSLVAVFAYLFLKEAVTVYQWLALLLSFIGVAFIAGFHGIHTDATAQLAYWAACGGAILTALAYVQVRSLAKTEHPLVIVLYFPLLCVPLSALLLLKNFVIPDLKQLLALAMIGIFTQLGQINLTKGLKLLPAARASGLAYSQVLFAAVLAWFFFDETPNGELLLGSLLIGSGIILSQFRSPKMAQ